ncbi:MAG: hypothetical protein D6B25_08995 [Desulfobulbaceae bacterium]|nr:MAG: hypothetical protein D6B25_08995 [Desulfobulbaceae bacterium]
MSRRRKKIEYCYNDYIKTMSEEEATVYKTRLAPLIEIMARSTSDHEIMNQAKAYDAEHGTDIFEAAVQLTVYCIACSKFACDC